MTRRLNRANNIADLRHLAKRRLPSQLTDVEHISLKTRICGQTLDSPVILAPTGMSRLFHHGKELAVARAAEKSGALSIRH